MVGKQYTEYIFLPTRRKLQAADENRVIHNCLLFINKYADAKMEDGLVDTCCRRTRYMVCIQNLSWNN
jgi:hypothetical protein